VKIFPVGVVGKHPIRILSLVRTHHFQMMYQMRITLGQTYHHLSNNPAYKLTGAMIMMLWQLKNLVTGEALNEPQRLPENWGPIFGMAGIQDRLGDLSWLGDAYANQGWVEVGEETTVPLTVEEATATIEAHLQATAWAVAEDNLAMTKGQRAAWVAFRQALRDVPLQVGFPANIVWPTEPA